MKEVEFLKQRFSEHEGIWFHMRSEKEAMLAVFEALDRRKRDQEGIAWLSIAVLLWLLGAAIYLIAQ